MHVSNRFSVHHQESSTVHTSTGIFHTGIVDCLPAGSGWNWFQLHPHPASKQSVKPALHTFC